jgi:hypothetical protein
MRRLAAYRALPRGRDRSPGSGDSVPLPRLSPSGFDGPFSSETQSHRRSRRRSRPAPGRRPQPGADCSAGLAGADPWKDATGAVDWGNDLVPGRADDDGDAPVPVGSASRVTFASAVRSPSHRSKAPDAMRAATSRVASSALCEPAMSPRRSGRNQLKVVPPACRAGRPRARPCCRRSRSRCSRSGPGASTLGARVAVRYTRRPAWGYSSAGRASEWHAGDAERCGHPLPDHDRVERYGPSYRLWRRGDNNASDDYFGSPCCVWRHWWARASSRGGRVLRLRSGRLRMSAPTTPRSTARRGYRRRSQTALPTASGRTPITETPSGRHLRQFVGACMGRGITTPDVSAADYGWVEPALPHELDLALCDDRFECRSPNEQPSARGDWCASLGRSA